MEMKDVGMDEAMREKLKNSLAFQIKPDFKYVPKAYRNDAVPKVLWPVFVLKGLDGPDYLEISDALDFEERTVDGKKLRIPRDSGRMALLSCQHGIVTWRNLRDRDGNVLPSPTVDLDTGMLKLQALRCLTPTLMYELSNAIAEQSRLTDEELLGLE